VLIEAAGGLSGAFGTIDIQGTQVVTGQDATRFFVRIP
jgi:hypothetical protein